MWALEGTREFAGKGQAAHPTACGLLYSPRAPGSLLLEGGSIHKRAGRRTNPEKDSHSPFYRWDTEAQRWGVTSPRFQS